VDILVKQRRALRTGASGGSLSDGGIRSRDGGALARGVLLSQLVLPECTSASARDFEYFQYFAKAAYSWGSAYAAAKAGLLGLTRYNAAEAARKGVRVNAICPGR